MSLTGNIGAIRTANIERAQALIAKGFTDRQARFLLTVMQHSGVFVERQYCRFAGIAHGQKTHDFVGRLVARNFAREIQPGPLHRGRLYHVHYKPLYAAIEEPDNRNRKRASTGRVVERLMLLDGVLEGGDLTWLATERDKQRYFLDRLDDYRLTPENLPHLGFGEGSSKTLRLFPDKLPIGVDTIGHEHVFLYLLKRSAPVDFRTFLGCHCDLLKMVHRWTLRILVPSRFAKAIRLYQHVVREELGRPLGPSDADELKWYFGQRKLQTDERQSAEAARFREAARKFRLPRFQVLYRLWLRHGDNVIWNTQSSILADKLERGEASVEFVVLNRQYLHLSHLVGVA